MPMRDGAIQIAAAKQNSRAGSRAIGRTRTWDASNGSLRTFIGMTREEDTAHLCSLASFDVSFRALSGASFDASEEVSVSRRFRCLNGAQASKGTKQ